MVGESPFGTLLISQFPTCLQFLSSDIEFTQSQFYTRKSASNLNTVIRDLSQNRQHSHLIFFPSYLMIMFVLQTPKRLKQVEKKDILTKILSILGTVLVWLPIMAPIMFSIAVIIQEHIFRFDYLMPAELFQFALVGGGLLTWASLRAHSRWRLISWGFGIAVGVLVGGQVLAIVTGLASGEAEPIGWWWTLVLTSIVVYSLALIQTGVGGVLLLYYLFKRL